jgi:hypothetical protein
LLSNGRRSAPAPTFEIFFDSVSDFLPIEAVMLEESSILRGNYRISKMGRNSIDWHETISLPVWRVLCGCGEPAFNLHRGKRRVDPAQENKKDRDNGIKHKNGAEYPDQSAFCGAGFAAFRSLGALRS